MNNDSSSTSSSSSLSSSSNLVSMFNAMVRMALATFSSRILGLVREQCMAIYFGASGLTDAFIVAYRIPNLLRDLFAEGAFSSAFIPVFTTSKLAGKEKAKKLLWSMFLLLGGITGIIGLGIFVGSTQLVELFASRDFVSHPQKFSLAVGLTKILSPFLLCISLAALFMGALNSFKVFFIPSVAPALFNATMIGTMVIGIHFSSSTDPFQLIYWPCYGAMLGGVIQVLVQIPSLLKNALGPTNPFPLITPESKKVFLLLIPGVFGMAATQINLIVSTMLATSYEGAVSWLNYAFRLFQFPVGILSVSLATTGLVHFSDHWKNNQPQEALKILTFNLKMSHLLLMPCVIFLMELGPQAVNIIFEHGIFSHNDTLVTAQYLKYYAIGLLFYGPYKILVPIFYAIDKAKIPVFCSALGILVNIIFCLYTVPKYGPYFLAMGASVSIIVNVILLSLFLATKNNFPLSMFINISTLKFLVSAFGSYLIIHRITPHVYDFNGYLLKKVMCLSLLGVVLGLSYLLLLMIFGEGKLVFQFTKKIFRRK